MAREGGPSSEDMGVETGDDTIKNMADTKGKRGSRVKEDFLSRAKVDRKEIDQEISGMTLEQVKEKIVQTEELLNSNKIELNNAQDVLLDSTVEERHVAQEKLAEAQANVARDKYYIEALKKKQIELQ